MLKQTNIEKLAALLLLCTALAACDTDFDNPVDTTGSSASAGDADFTTFVAIGDSLTAGYADRALYQSGQVNSYPNILATQFAKVGGGAFRQPLMDDNLGGLLIGGSPLPGFDNRLVLDGVTQTPEPIAGDATTELHPGLNSNPLSGAFNNMGVPGTKSFHLATPSYGDLAGIFDINTNQPVDPPTANPYFVRFASAPGTTMIADAANQAPTFFLLWAGNNDVLSFATSGGSGTDQAGNFNPASYGSNDITDPTVFANTYNSLVNAFLTANPNAKGVLINIPDVGTIPFFTTVPHNPIPLDQATADALNAAYAPYNAGLQQAVVATAISADEAAQRTIQFAAGATNAAVILDESLTDLTGLNASLINMRQATADDLLVLTTRSKIGEEAVAGNPATVWGLGTPLTDADVLIPAEIAAIETARTAFNATIKGIADADTNLALFDAAGLMAELQASGINFGTGSITADYGTGGGFSLDGVHPTARGYAVVANGIIDSINSAFNASVPKTDPGAFSTIFIK